MQPKTILDQYGKPINLVTTHHAQVGVNKTMPGSQRTARRFKSRQPTELLSTLRDLERNNPIARAIVQVWLGTWRVCLQRPNAKRNKRTGKLLKNYPKRAK